MTRTNPLFSICGKAFSIFAGTAILGLVVSVASPSIANAQKKEKAPKVKTFDFSGDNIDGELVKPDGDFVDPRQFANHSNLIRIRKDFIREILKSAEDL